MPNLNPSYTNLGSYDRQYIAIINELLNQYDNDINVKKDRTGVGTVSTFAKQINFDLSNGEFPLLTSKFTPFKAMANEALFFLKGLTNNNWLVERGCNIWTPWAREDGELGPIYGKQLRDFNGFDQLEYVLNELKTNPDSRRIMFSYYNPAMLPDASKSHVENINNNKAVLPPCHLLYCFMTEVKDGVRYLNLHLSIRSNDMLLGNPFNFAQVALLTYIFAHYTGMKPGKISSTSIDAHMYLNRVDDAKAWLSDINNKIQNNSRVAYPKLIIKAKPNKHPEDYDISDFEIIDYKHFGKYLFKVAV